MTWAHQPTTQKFSVAGQQKGNLTQGKITLGRTTAEQWKTILSQGRSECEPEETQAVPPRKQPRLVFPQSLPNAVE